MSSLATIERAIDRYTDKAPAQIHKVRRELVAATFREIVRTSPVKTGALRASNQIVSDEQTAKVYFQARNRPNPFNPPRSVRRVLKAPQMRVVRIGVAKIPDTFGVVFIVNLIFYAWWVENGTSRMRGRFTYRSALRRTRASAREIAARATGDIYYGY